MVMIFSCPHVVFFCGAKTDISLKIDTVASTTVMFNAKCREKLKQPTFQMLSFHNNSTWSGRCTNSSRNFPTLRLCAFIRCVKGGVCAFFSSLCACIFFFSLLSLCLVIQYLSDSCKAANAHKGTHLVERECASRWFNQFGKHFSFWSSLITFEFELISTWTILFFLLRKRIHPLMTMCSIQFLISQDFFLRKKKNFK